SAGAWNNPSKWQPTAIVGRALLTDTEDVETALPVEFALEQNYPNPFNPTTSIAFTIPNATPVQLDVFNVLGQRVATLVNGQTMPAGQHTVSFDASDLTSGMYIYRLQAGTGFSQTRTMMLLK
ncbi:MAG: T9SS C-terminal target domain-containing protein, partial [Bacteroidetes bacterium]|nr:T9SS C-terminal target domain-containing protein [Bacteroidota bacterium]